LVGQRGFLSALEAVRRQRAHLRLQRLDALDLPR
jgi:hypothetical protein